MSERSGSLQSSLARHVASGPNGPTDAFAACKAAWHRDGIFCVNVETMKSWAHKKQIEQIGTEIFGRRKP